jgi:hypothetical protein
MPLCFGLLSDFFRASHLKDTLTTELKPAVEQAGDSPVRLTDPETHRSYVILSAEVYERLLSNAKERSEGEPIVEGATKDARTRRIDEPRRFSTEIIDWSAPSLQGTLPKLPGDLPHGPVAPPKEVVEQIAALDERLLKRWLP